MDDMIGLRGGGESSIRPIRTRNLDGDGFRHGVWRLETKGVRNGGHRQHGKEWNEVNKLWFLMKI